MLAETTQQTRTYTSENRKYPMHLPCDCVDVRSGNWIGWSAVTYLAVKTCGSKKKLLSARNARVDIYLGSATVVLVKETRAEGLKQTHSRKPNI